MQDILDAATSEFADKGFEGAYVDNIAALTETSKRMIYYHFGSKEELYLAVLEGAYRRARTVERGLQLDSMEPVEAMKALVRFRFGYHHDNPDYIRLVMNENIHNGKYLARSKVIDSLSAPAIELIRQVYDRGCVAGVFRAGLSPVDIHMSISSLSFYNVSNRHTFSILFGRDMHASGETDLRREHVVEMVLRYMQV